MKDENELENFEEYYANESELELNRICAYLSKLNFDSHLFDVLLDYTLSKQNDGLVFELLPNPLLIMM